MKPFVAFFVFLVAFLVALPVSGQKNYATNIKQELYDDNLIITYDVLPDDGTQSLEVTFMVTYNGKKVPTTWVSGEWEGTITPGVEKVITWNYKKDFTEDISRVQVNVFAIKVNEPRAAFEIASKGNNGYAPCEVRVRNLSSNATLFHWDFGDPSSGINNNSSEREPVHTYNREGTYQITLNARNSIAGKPSEFFTNILVMEHEPVSADFTFEVSGTKPPYEVRFRSTSRNADTYSWNFGDAASGKKNNTSAESAPSHKYKQAGTYLVVLDASSTVSKTTDTKRQEVTIRAPETPVAAFVYSLTQISAPSSAVFSNTSTNATAFEWNFGDPASREMNISREKDAAHYYQKAGKYVVTLTASNQEGKSVKYTETLTIEGPPKPPVAGFKLSSSSFISPSSVIFTNTSTDADSYSWDFGDPGSQNSSREKDPVHTYTRPGQYKVTLKASSSKSPETSEWSETITLTSPVKTAVAAFTVENNHMMSPATIRFTDNSTNAVSWLWNFGDPASGKNNTSEDRNPSHLYTRAGQYKVTLTVKNNAGDPNTATSDVVVNAPAGAVAAFVIDNNNLESPATIRFTDQSSNAVSTLWNFGDPASGSNNSSTQTNPAHLYTKPGKYVVTLTVKNAAGVSATTTGEVNIIAPASAVAAFRIENNHMMSPATIRFSDNSVNAVSHLWNFGDPASGSKNSSAELNPSHLYSKEGTYKVTLTVKNAAGITASSTQEVVVKGPPEAEASFAIENNNLESPATIRFTDQSSNAVSTLWNFGDPASGSNNSSTQTNPTHLYTKPGKFVVTLTVKNAAGVSTTTTGEVNIVAPASAVAAFRIENNHMMSPATIRFSDNSVNAVSHLWNFGDPASGSKNSSAELNPSHLYSKEGTYKVTLTVKNAAGITASSTQEVVVKGPPEAEASFAIENNNLESPATIRFTDQSSNAVSTLWNFGDPASGSNNSSTQTNPTHLYTKPGKYVVTLTVKNAAGMSTTTTGEVVIAEPAKPPEADFSIDNNFQIGPVTVSFTNRSQYADRYEWIFGDPASGDKNGSTDENPVHTYLNPGKYMVTLTAYNQSTAVSGVSMQEVVIQEPILDPVANFDISYTGRHAPLDVTFTNQSKHAESYRWDFGDVGSKNNGSAGTHPVHRYEKAGIFKITLEVRSAKTGKTHQVTKEITIEQKYHTYLKKFGKPGSDEIVRSLISSGDGQYLALVNEQNSTSTLLTFDAEGSRFNEKKVNANLHDAALRPGHAGFVLAGIIPPNDLILYQADNQLNLGSQKVLYNNVLDVGYHFTTLHLAVAENGESGIAANLINDKGETNIWFQKADADGKPVAGRGKTFKFSGYKVANQVIATKDGGFALSGGYQLDNNSMAELMLGVVNPDGTGNLHRMESRQKITGSDLVEFPGNYFTMLASRESPGDPGFSEISLKLVDRDVTPLNCEIDLIGKMRTADLLEFPARILLTEKGFILLTHHFNGTDSDITLVWVDKSGTKMERIEQIARPGDQFGTALWQEPDGSLVIAGAEKIKGDYDAIILKTDPLGKIPDMNQTGQP